MSVPTPGTWVKQSGLRVALSGQLFDLLVKDVDLRRELSDRGEHGLKGSGEFRGDMRLGFAGEGVA